MTVPRSLTGGYRNQIRIGVPQPGQDGGGGVPWPGQDGVPPVIGQQMEYLIRSGRYTSCVHAGLS